MHTRARTGGGGGAESRHDLCNILHNETLIQCNARLFVCVCVCVCARSLGNKPFETRDLVPYMYHF